MIKSKIVSTSMQASTQKPLHNIINKTKDSINIKNADKFINLPIQKNI